MEYLSRRSIPFVEKNIGRDPGARQELLTMGLRSLPVIMISGKTLSGFSAAAIEAALEGLRTVQHDGDS